MLCEDKYHLQYLSLSVNRIRGTLPDCVASLQSLKFLFMYSNLLSGSLTHSQQRREAAYPALRIFVLARNYFGGAIDSLQLNKAETVVLSSNRFSCHAPTLNDAAQLGQGANRKGCLSLSDGLCRTF